jgi:hypothetical protein
VMVVCMFVLGRERQTGILQAAPEQILNNWSDDDKSKAGAKAAVAAAAAAKAPAPDTALHADHLLFSIWSKA